MRLPVPAASAWRIVVRNWTILILAVVIAVLSAINHRPGHNWGDDFALYLSQGKALVEGNVGEVMARNHYTVEESGWRFSPYSYPWGTPILLAPVIAVWGIDFAKLKLLETFFFVGFLVLFYKLVARRAGAGGGLVLTALIGLSVNYVGWTDTVLSEFPYLFFLALTLWWIDRCRARETWERGPTWPLVVLGLLVGFTFSIRREGVMLVLAVAAVHGAYLWRRRRAVTVGPPPWRRLALPYWTAGGFVAALQLVLPSDLIPEQVASLGRIPRNLIFYRDILAEHIGLHDTRTSPLDYLGSRDIALALLTIFVVLACLGLLIRIVTAFEEDASLIFYLLGAMVMIGRLSSRDGRYLFSMTPVIAYFAYQGIAATLNATLEPEQSRSKWVKRAPTAVAVAFLMLFVAANSTDLYRRTVRRLAEPAGQVQYGPESAKPQEMIDAVMRYTRRDEIVAFSRARLLNLYTERQSLQLTRVEHILERADWYMMRKDSFYSQSLISPEEAAEVGLTLVWENEIYVLWKVPPRY